MGAAHCPSRKPSVIAVPVVQDISASSTHGSKRGRWPSSPQSVSHESSPGNEAINQPSGQVIRNATVPAKAAMPKASSDRNAASIPIRYRRWSYDALEEDQKRSLRMLCPMETAKLIPELEHIPPLTMAASSCNASHLEQHLEALSADLIQPQAQVDACGARDQCSAQDLDVIQSQIHSGLNDPSQYVWAPWSADAEVTCNSMEGRAFRQDLENTEQGSAKLITLPPGLVEESASAKLVGKGSLREDLQLLRGRDHRCVVVVRKIKQLGFQAPSLLASHFSKHGAVEDVLVALTNSRRKSQRKKVDIRTRPAAMGFVVMKSAEGAARILQCGELQDVQGSCIQVHPFSSFASHNDD
eukprot:gnl/MRDRNA2_/MRDRNA2_162677_c0_seq1.p1 gnl/MRDRNA2_/MRDRNA2_162677_c0~~gnl/MRDRNA2_/MRDRNA2_162677_c0_seq1.p1  ORF type:complete len:356 (+),score=51.82 gnl/MRDRNA2_/MRDRNA2_162677_c0_seq1:87-1154(+)